MKFLISVFLILITTSSYAANPIYCVEGKKMSQGKLFRKIIPGKCLNTETKIPKYSECKYGKIVVWDLKKKINIAFKDNEGNEVTCPEKF